MTSSLVLRAVFNRSFFQKLIALSIFGLLLYVLRDFFATILMTFLFAYLFGDLSRFTALRLHDFLQYRSHGQRKYLARVGFKTIVTVIYTVFVAVCVFIVSSLLPSFIIEASEFVKTLPDLVLRLRSIFDRLFASLPAGLSTVNPLAPLLDPAYFQSLGANALTYLKNIGIFLTHFVVALVLSYVFLIERSRIEHYLSGMRGTSFEFLHEEFSLVFRKLSKAFGLIFKAQSVIAAVNTLLTIIGITIIGIIFDGNVFPYTLTIALIVFLCGFVPVLGTFLSSVPIFLISYSIGAWPAVLSVAAMIAAVHAVEAYYLNPKIVSSYTEFPVFVTFLILLVGEHLFGVIGFLIGTPIFLIVVDLMKDIDAFIRRVSSLASGVSEAHLDVKKALHEDIRLSRSGRRADESPL